MKTLIQPERFGLISLASVFLLLVVFPTTSFGQTTTTQDDVEKTKDADEEKDQRQIERDLWTIYYAQQIPKYTFFLESDEETPLKSISEPKLRYWNSVRQGNNHGELFIWTRNGRCVLAGAILSYQLGSDVREVAHEFHSFSAEKIVGDREGEAFEISAPGVNFKPVPGAKPPAKSRALRMVQLRKMAKLFEASTMSKANSTMSRKSESLPLRALSQPIFRYETKEVSDDGAIFAYVTGTDPEVLVAIESRQTEDGPQWVYGAARFTDLPITLKYKDKTVWEFDQASTYVGGYEFKHLERHPLSPNLEEEEEETKGAATETKVVNPKSNVKGK